MQDDLRLIDHYGRLLASEPFWAGDDQDAIEAGATVLQACNDVATMFQIRRNRGLVGAGDCECGPLARQAIGVCRQDAWPPSAAIAATVATVPAAVCG
jgi:hypothetical protein